MKEYWGGRGNISSCKYDLCFQLVRVVIDISLTTEIKITTSFTSAKDSVTVICHYAFMFSCLIPLPGASKVVFNLQMELFIYKHTTL